jgi:hypothetical protein
MPFIYQTQLGYADIQHGADLFQRKKETLLPMETGPYFSGGLGMPKTQRNSGER